MRKLINGSPKFTNLSRLKPFDSHFTSVQSNSVSKFSSSQNCKKNQSFTELNLAKLITSMAVLCASSRSPPVFLATTVFSRV